MMNRENLQASLKRDLKPSTTDKLVCQSCTMVPVELKENDSCTLNSVDANPLLCLCSGGWALTRVTPQPALVGHSLEVTCLVRGKRPLSEVIFYRDGVEVMRNQGNNPKFFLSNVTIEDQGMYSCRASWVTNSQTHSVISVDTPGRVRGNFLPPNANIQIQLLQSANNVFFFQRFCPNQFWRLMSTKTRCPTGWSSFATTNTTFLLLPLHCTFISTRTITDWEQQHLRTSCRSDRLQAGTAVRSGFLRWTWSGGVSPKALDKCQVFRDSTAHHDLTNVKCYTGNKPSKAMLSLTQ